MIRSVEKKLGLVLKEKDRIRRVHTKLGVVEYSRDYFYDKTQAQHHNLLDSLLGIKAYERVGRTISAELVNLAADMSYAKSAAIVTDGVLSRQTVKNHIQKVNVPELPKADKLREVKELHVFADEDHVHLQKPGKVKGKKSQIVPLVTVTEGIEKAGTNRNRTKRKAHFVEENFSTKNLWKSVEGYIATNYDIDKLEKIYLHSDGGMWIKNGLENFAQVVRVMDGYHYEKAAKRIAKIFPSKNVRQHLNRAIAEDDASGTAKYLRDLMIGCLEDDNDTVKKFIVYLRNNWEAIRNLKMLEIPGSCTESQISHVLSERFSRDPLGWSKDGLGKLASIRVNKENHHRICSKDFEIPEIEGRYREYAEQMVEKNIKEKLDWSMFDREAKIFDTGSATQIMLRNLGTNHGITWS